MSLRLVRAIMYQNALFMGNKYSLLCTLDIHTKVSWYTPKICGLATKLSVVYSATQWFVRSSLEYLIFGPVFLGFVCAHRWTTSGDLSYTFADSIVHSRSLSVSPGQVCCRTLALGRSRQQDQEFESICQPCKEFKANLSWVKLSLTITNNTSPGKQFTTEACGLLFLCFFLFFF